MQIFRGIFLYEPNLHQRTLAQTTLREKEREKEKEKERERGFKNVFVKHIISFFIYLLNTSHQI